MLRRSNMRCAQLNKLVFSVFPLFSSSIDIVWISRENVLLSTRNILSTRFCEQAALPMTANEVWRQRTWLENPFEKYYIPLRAANDVLTMSTAVRFSFSFWNSRNKIHAVFNDHRKRFPLQTSTMRCRVYHLMFISREIGYRTCTPRRTSILLNTMT